MVVFLHILVYFIRRFVCDFMASGQELELIANVYSINAVLNSIDNDMKNIFNHICFSVLFYPLYKTN